MSNLGTAGVLKKFFEVPGGRVLGMEELKPLPPADREELADLAAVELGLLKIRGEKYPEYAAAAA